MIRSVILVTDTRFWSNAYFTSPPTPPTAALCRLLVAKAVNIVNLSIRVALIWVFLYVYFSVFLNTRH